MEERVRSKYTAMKGKNCRNLRTGWVRKPSCRKYMLGLLRADVNIEVDYETRT
jgi:hypothetical protein